MCHEWSQVATWTSSAPPPSSRGRSTPEWFLPEPNSSRRRMVSSLLSLRRRREVLTGSSMWPDLAKGFLSLSLNITSHSSFVRFVDAEFPEGQSLLDFHVAEVTSDDGLLVIVNHAGNLSSLYISDVVSEYEVGKRLLILALIVINWLVGFEIVSGDKIILCRSSSPWLFRESCTMPKTPHGGPPGWRRCKRIWTRSGSNQAFKTRSRLKLT